MTSPLPLPSKYFRAYLAKGFIITGLQMAETELSLTTRELARLNLIETIRDRYFLSTKAGAYWAFSEVCEFNG